MTTILLLIHLAIIYFIFLKIEWLEKKHDELYFELKNNGEDIRLIVMDDKMKFMHWVKRNYLFLFPIVNIYAIFFLLIPTINAYKEKNPVFKVLRVVGMEVYFSQIKNYL